MIAAGCNYAYMRTLMNTLFFSRLHSAPDSATVIGITYNTTTITALRTKNPLYIQAGVIMESLCLLARNNIKAVGFTLPLWMMIF